MNTIEVKGLVKNYDTKQALKGVNFSVPSGSIYGFLGPNGAGKTTTIKILIGLLKYDAGSVSLFGQSTNLRQSEINLKVGYLPQDPVFPNYYTGEEVMEMVSKLYKMDQKVAQKRITELFNGFKLDKDKHRRVNTYSRGMKQRLGLASVMLSNPELVLLDEPVSALDPEGRVEVLNMMRDMRGQMTVFFSSHILADVERVCDRITIINHGEVIAESTTDLLIKKYSPCEYLVRVRPESVNKARELLTQQPYKYELLDDSRFKVWNPAGQPEVIEEKVLPLLVQNGITISEFVKDKFDLEKIFFKLIGEHENNVAR